jgi:hypothetical protein
MDVSELLKRYAAGERDFCSVVLSNADLSEASLNGANLFGANLSVANLSKASLKGANLSVANLSKAYLSEAYLFGANLGGTGLSGTDLSGADLRGASLFKAKLNKVNLSNADLSNANWAEAELTDINWDKTKIDGTTFPYKWEGLHFRSKSEIKIAQALDCAGVLFYPNSKARLSQAEIRINRESDFLVFQSGKFGILEVDGRPYHQTAAADHERDRLFKRYGIRVIERFDATRCWNEPDKVVKEFLEILSQA